MTFSYFDIAASTLIPLSFLSFIPGLTLLLTMFPLYYTVKLEVVGKKYYGRKVLWLCTITNILYGLYDLYFFFYQSDVNIRFDLSIFGPIFYFSLLYWFITYRQRNLPPLKKRLKKRKKNLK